MREGDDGCSGNSQCEGQKGKKMVVLVFFVELSSAC